MGNEDLTDEEELLELKISEFDPLLVNEDFRKIEFLDWEEEFYIVKKDYLSTRCWYMLSKKRKWI